MPRPPKRPPTSLLTVKRGIQTCFRRVYNHDDDGDNWSRESDPIVWPAQVAAQLGITRSALKRLTTSGALPAPPETRRAGDRWDREVLRAWRLMPAERRKALQESSESDFDDIGVRDDDEDRLAVDDEPEHRRTRKRGARGVARSGNRWAAFLYYDKANHCLGRFDTIEEASAAYESARAAKLARKAGR